MLSKRYESTEVDCRTWLHVPSGNSGPPAVTLTKWLKWCVPARYMTVLSLTVSTFKRRMEKKLGQRREKWGAMHRLVIISFWDCFTVTLGGLMLLYFMEGGGGGLVVPSPRYFGRLCAKLWYSGPTWTKNCAYRTVPFLDFGVLEWYWNYNQLFWKLMKGIGCCIVGCIPSECFKLTQKLLDKWVEIIRTFEFEFVVSWLASEASRKIFVKMNILCANFLDKSAYWVRKISLGKIIGGGGARAPCAPRFLRPCCLLPPNSTKQWYVWFWHQCQVIVYIITAWTGQLDHCPREPIKDK